MEKISSAIITGGMIEGSRFIEYIYQFIHSLGVNGLLISNELISLDFPDNSRRKIAYNPTQLILDAGYVSLALHHIMQRSLLTESEIIVLRRLIYLSQLTTLRLFVFKQLMIGTNAALHVLKNHMTSHFDLLWDLYGDSGIWDTDFNESAHKMVKKHWVNSSKRLHQFQGTELLQMDRMIHIAKQIRNSTTDNLTNDQIHEIVSNEKENNSLKNDYSILDKDTSVYEFRLGYTKLYSTIQSGSIEFIENSIQNGNMKCQWNVDDSNLNFDYIPIHPLIGLSGLNAEITRNLRLVDKYPDSNWKDIIYNCMVNRNKNTTWKCMLLNGTRLIDKNTNESYIIYSKRDQIIKKAPGSTSYSKKIDRFNVIEVMFSELDEDGNEITKFIPARVMSIIRFYDENNSGNELIMYLISYLIHENITSNTNLRYHPMNNIYKYHFHYGALWLDLVLPEEVSNNFILYCLFTFTLFL
jgi:hypothetical protein